MDINTDQAIGLMLNFANSIFFDSSDSETEVERAPRVQQYAEEIVPRLSDKTFKSHFRINLCTFEDLLGKLYSVSDSTVHCGTVPVPLDKQLMVTIWCLANLECFRSVADRFGISRSTCWSILYRVCNLLLKVNKKFKIISWPSQVRAEEIEREFRAINGFPGIIGAIDGSHIRILKPKENPNSYCNRKSYHSVLLQGVCDSKKLFLDVYAGEPGSIHDMRLFRKSDLNSRIRNGSVIISEDHHLIGDLAYKLSHYLLVGFKNNVVLTPAQINFNNKLSQCRVVIENAFALLKGRFRRLKSLETTRLDLIPLIIVSGTVLHNICILNGDLLEDIADLQDLEEEILIEENVYAVVDDVREDLQAVRKRNNIMNALLMN